MYLYSIFSVKNITSVSNCTKDTLVCSRYNTVENMQSLLQRDAEEEESIDTFLQPTEEEEPNLPYDNVDETAETIPTTVPTQPEVFIEEPIQE